MQEMAPRVEIIGVHPVEAADPCYLVELWVRGSEVLFDLGEFTQEESGQPQSNWQVPYDEKILDHSGTRILADPWKMRSKDVDVWRGDVRIAFFFHYLKAGQPMRTPFGTVATPDPTRMPERLSIMTYDPPR
jgi:hypothetical protein